MAPWPHGAVISFSFLSFLESHGFVRGPPPTIPNELSIDEGKRMLNSAGCPSKLEKAWVCGDRSIKQPPSRCGFQKGNPEKNVAAIRAKGPSSCQEIPHPPLVGDDGQHARRRLFLFLPLFLFFQVRVSGAPLQSGHDHFGHCIFFVLCVRIIGRPASMSGAPVRYDFGSNGEERAAGR
jgi:hypothetical protein